MVSVFFPEEGGKAKDRPALQGSGTCLRLFRSCICRMESMIDVWPCAPCWPCIKAFDGCGKPQLSWKDAKLVVSINALALINILASIR